VQQRGQATFLTLQVGMEIFVVQQRVQIPQMKQYSISMHLLKHAPRLKVESAATLVEHLYGIRAQLTPLPSERDQNFLLESESGQKFVLKIANALEEPAFLDAQNQLMSHLPSRLSFCPRVVPTPSGDQMTRIESESGSTHFVRVVTYLPGKPLAEIQQRSPELLRDLGRKLGQLDRELADFDHPAIHRDFHWDLANGITVVNEYGDLIEELTLRRLVNGWVETFGKEVGPLLNSVRRSVIHGDANDYNVLVGTDDSEQEVSGLIDLGDVVHSYTVADLAVAIAYVVLEKPDPLDAASQVLAGYRRHYGLLDVEIDALWGLALMRLCMSVCLAAYQKIQRPDDVYLDISQRAIRNTLPKLVAIDPRDALEAFRATAC
jgi:Ser/Thr protein kinase RdoA (MazF antagonist)